LATGAEQPATVGDRQPPAIRHNAVDRAGHRPAPTRREIGQLGVDLTQGEPGRQQAGQMPAHHELPKIQPLQGSGPLGDLEQPAADPVADRGRWHRQHIRNHRRGVVSPHAGRIGRSDV